MLLTKAEATAKKVLNVYGIDSTDLLRSIELKDLIQARGAYYEETDLENKDGRIVSYHGRSVITINKSIFDPGKKRFTAAHELGHYELHKELALNADTQFELCNWFQSGSHEKEANDFASELLMPLKIFREECSGKKFGPKLIEHLSETFIVSKTAAILRFAKVGNHPVFIVCTKDNKVNWMKMSNGMESIEHEFIANWLRYKVRVATKLPPPRDSVVGQIINTRSRNIEKCQEIDKSTWFLTHPEDNTRMHEYCNYVYGYNFALSVIWED
jgi:Zn-dependent peptidase ImmA (M78 family)